MAQQQTIHRAVELDGVGLHTGSPAVVRIAPAAPDSGILFVRGDLDGASVPARHEHLKSSSLATTLSRGRATVSTVEHLLAALRGLGVDNALVEVDGPEVPILDGSAEPFVRAILKAGRRSQPALRRDLFLRQPASVRQGDRAILAVPSNEFRISYAIDFDHPAIGYQAVTSGINEEVFTASIAPARTFCLLRDVQAMKAGGLALGGSLDNAVVVGDDGILNGSMRFADEFVRHKVLDLIGDLALLGVPLRAHVIVFKGGHQMHAALMRRIMERRSAFTVDDAEQRLPQQVFERFAHLGERLVQRPQVLTA